MNIDSFYLKDSHKEEILKHIKKNLPEEACGLIAGTFKNSKAVYLITNELHSPDRFRMAPVEQLAAFLDIEKNEWDLQAIFHSHPNGPQIPSEIDLKEFAYPGVLYLIWFPKGDSWDFRCYVLSKSSYKPVTMKIVDD